MDSEGISLPLIHKHLMMPCNDARKGDCCGLLETISDGYICKSCDFFVHKKCSDPPSLVHEDCSHTLHLRTTTMSDRCDVCGKDIVDLFYTCNLCHLSIDIFCAKYPPPAVIDIPEGHYYCCRYQKEVIHHRRLYLQMRLVAKANCAAKCGKTGSDKKNERIYGCYNCDIVFHVDCIWRPSEVNKHPLEVNHSHHSLHPLKLFTDGIPDYSDGKCRLCRNKIDGRLFYHCSLCNFTLDMRCVVNPPQPSLPNLKAHDHPLTLFPRLESFTCNACGLKEDRSPYICEQCGFKIHEECIDLPRVININRHDHRVSRTSVLGVVNSVCGICRQKVDSTCGGYSCVRCPDFVVHSKCATRKDVWNGKELEGVPEEAEDIAPYVVIDDNTIQHFSHKEHYLRLHVNGVLYEETKRCRACTHPIFLQSFYGCIDCDFSLHQNCAEFPTRKWHVQYKERLTLVTKETDFRCGYCNRRSNGFRYQLGVRELDVLCGSISEPFFHPSHPDHPLYYIESKRDKVCNGCQSTRSYVLRCIGNGCEFVVCFICATLPQVIKHEVDDHPLSLCYGKKAIGKYRCDICVKEMNPEKEKWFYTCKDHKASLHKDCVLGNYSSCHKLGDIIKIWHRSFLVVINNIIPSPICLHCRSICMEPMILMLFSDHYVCSTDCGWHLHQEG